MSYYIGLFTHYEKFGKCDSDSLIDSNYKLHNVLSIIESIVESNRKKQRDKQEKKSKRR